MSCLCLTTNVESESMTQDLWGLRWAVFLMCKIELTSDGLFGRSLKHSLFLPGQLNLMREMGGTWALQLLKEVALPDKGYCFWMDKLWSVVEIADWCFMLKPERGWCLMWAEILLLSKTLNISYARSIYRTPKIGSWVWGEWAGCFWNTCSCVVLLTLRTFP